MKTYNLPLKWCKNLPDEIESLIGEIPLQTIDIISHLRGNELIRIYDLVSPYETLKQVINACMLRGNPNDLLETLRDLDSYSIIKKWCKSKQIFTMDESFANTLVETENIRLTKDIFDYLPFKTFYLDFEDATDLSEKILGKGAFITVEKHEASRLTKSLKDNYEDLLGRSITSCWSIHICKVTDELFFNDVMEFPNDDFEIKSNELAKSKKINVIKGPVTNFKTEEADLDRGVYQKFILQTLIYLSSAEPDIRENENTKTTYRKPKENAIPKNKYSEIQAFDVGVRFGTSYRKWKKSVASSDTKREGIKGGKKKPHFVRAHWQNYWYGTKDNKVKKPKWKAEFFTGQEYLKDVDTVIHKMN